MKEMEYVVPDIVELGSIAELTGSGGSNNDEGWYWSKLAR